MLETSAEYHQLELSCAKSKDLVKDLHPHLVLDDDHSMRLKSYILLCHAAFEEYLEKVSLLTLAHAYVKFEEQNAIPKALFALLSFYESPVRKHIGSFDLAADFRTVCQESFQWAMQMHKAALGEVHGIRTHHQNSIFMPIGIKLHGFDHLLSQALNSYGQGRGRVAHEFRIVHQHPKAACMQDVAQIIQLLLPFDQMLNTFSSEVFVI